MLPFLSMSDVLFAVGVVLGVSAFAALVYARAWRERPAMVAERVAEAESAVAHRVPADSSLTASV